jgi:hypothetical protein
MAPDFVFSSGMLRFFKAFRARFHRRLPENRLRQRNPKVKKSLAKRILKWKPIGNLTNWIKKYKIDLGI